MAANLTEEGSADGQGLARKSRQVKPILRIAGTVSRAGRPVNLVENHGFHGQLGGSFSLMCTLRMDRLNPWQRIFDFSFKADIHSITAGAIDNTTNLHFTVFKGKTQKSVHVIDFFEPGKTATALFTVSKAGRMRVWKDGKLVGEVQGHAPYFHDRPHLMIGGHDFYEKQCFRGKIGNMKIWDWEVIWPSAKQAVPADTWGVVVGRPTSKPPEPMQKKLESEAALADAEECKEEPEAEGSLDPTSAGSCASSVAEHEDSDCSP